MKVQRRHIGVVGGILLVVTLVIWPEYLMSTLYGADEYNPMFNSTHLSENAENYPPPKLMPWLNWPPPPTFPGTKWGNDVPQAHKNAIVMLFGYSDIDHVDQGFLAMITAIRHHTDFKTNADIVVMMYCSTGKTLDPKGMHFRYLKELNARLLWIDMDPLFAEAPGGLMGHNGTHYGMTDFIMYGKWFAFAMTNYEKCLFHDLDVQPLGNFDHYFDMPIGDSEGGFFVEGRHAPVNGGFWMITPSIDIYQELMTLSINAIKAGNIGKHFWQDEPVVSEFHIWDGRVGWGIPTPPAGMVYQQIANDWNFFAGNYDQGLMWYLCMRLKRCVRVKKACNLAKNEPCWEMNRKLGEDRMNRLAKWLPKHENSRYLRFAMHSFGIPSPFRPFCDYKMVGLSNAPNWIIKSYRPDYHPPTAPLAPTGETAANEENKLHAFLEKPYLYDFVHYTSRLAKPWHICSARGMPVVGITKGCGDDLFSIGDYCTRWRSYAKTYCTERIASPGSNGVCDVGTPPLKDNGKGESLLRFPRWIWQSDDVDYETTHVLPDGEHEELAVAKTKDLVDWALGRHPSSDAFYSNSSGPRADCSKFTHSTGAAIIEEAVGRGSANVACYKWDKGSRGPGGTKHHYRDENYCLPNVFLLSTDNVLAETLHRVMRVSEMFEVGHYHTRSMYGSEHFLPEQPERNNQSIWNMLERRYDNYTFQRVKEDNVIGMEVSYDMLYAYGEEMKHCTVSQFVNMLLPSVRFIVLLRNPVDRTWHDFVQQQPKLVPRVAYTTTTITGATKQVQGDEPSVAAQKTRDFHESVQSQIHAWNRCMFHHFTYEQWLLGEGSFKRRFRIYDTMDQCRYRRDIGWSAGDRDSNHQLVPHFDASKERMVNNHGRVALGLYYVYLRALVASSKNVHVYVDCLDCAGSPSKVVWNALDWLRASLSMTSEQFQFPFSLAEQHEEQQAPMNQGMEMPSVPPGFLPQMPAETRALLEEFYHPWNVKLNEALQDLDEFRAYPETFWPTQTVV